MKKFIVLGQASKTLLFPIILAIAMIIFNIINAGLNNNIGTKNIYSIICFFSQALGIMAIKLIPCIFKYKDDKIQQPLKNTFIDYLFLSIIVLFYMSMSFVLQFADIGMNLDVLNVTCLNEVLDIILLLILTKIFLDYKYYIHNVISLISFCIFGIIIDVILKHFSNFKPVDLVYFLDGIIRTIILCYFKYMMEIKFYKYWNIVFIVGLISLILILLYFLF